MTRLLKIPIIARSAIIADSSWIDMLAELSKTGILKMPPGVWANVASATDIPSNNTVAANAQKLGFI
jgi:hypothetical protein